MVLKLLTCVCIKCYTSQCPFSNPKSAFSLTVFCSYRLCNFPRDSQQSFTVKNNWTGAAYSRVPSLGRTCFCCGCHSLGTAWTRFVRNCWCCRSMQGERWVPAPGSNPDNLAAPLSYHRTYTLSSMNKLNQLIR